MDSLIFDVAVECRPGRVPCLIHPIRKGFPTVGILVVSFLFGEAHQSVPSRSVSESNYRVAAIPISPTFY
jgi:hypothetical protein